MEKTSGSIVPAEVDGIVEKATSLAEAYVIDCPQIAEAAAKDLQWLTAEYKRVEGIRLSITRPMDESKKNAINAFRPHLEKLESAANTLRGAINQWLLLERRRVEAEEAERRKREDEAARLVQAQTEEAERKFDEAVTSGDAALAEEAIELAESAQQQAQELSVATYAPAPAAQKLGGIGQRKSYKVQSIDLLALVKAAAEDPELLVYLSANSVEINKVVKSLGTRHKIPGVVAIESFGLSVRS